MATSGATFGKLPEFDPGTGDFEVYLECLECFIAANDIAGEKELQVFLTSIRDKAYGTRRSLLLPRTPTKATFKDAFGALKKYYIPESSVVTEMYRFHQPKHAKRESLSDFIVGLKKLAATCAFGAFLEEALRDRLIAGRQTEATRCRLLATPDAQLVSARSEVFAAGVSDLHWQRQAAGRRLQASAGKNARSSGFAKAEKTASQGLRVIAVRDTMHQ